MATTPMTLRPGALTLAEIRTLHEEGRPVQLDDAARAAMVRSREIVTRRLEAGETDYGINTGFGLLANTRIEPDQVEQLQENLILSHAAGTGDPLDDATVRLILVLKASSLAQGYSGVRPKLVDALLAMATHDVLPVIPSQGSVGASGDLAPLAHMSAALLGRGQVRHKGEVLPAVQGLARAGLEPMALAAKEGIALINGTQVSTALALSGLFAIENVFAAALVAGALSVDGMKGSDAPFDARIHEVRRQPGQIAVAAVMRRLMAKSGIRASHLDCERVQDPYSLRCQPQVMGAVLDLMERNAECLLREADAVTDNPLIFPVEPDGGDVLSGGNFHAEPVAFAADSLALAVAEIGSLSERRLSLLIDPKMSGLPPFLVEDSGLNSGFMIAHVTAAALVSENKSRAHPASVDSLPTSAGQEDHVSMATFAARRLAPMARNASAVVAIELLGAAQGIDFHAPHQTSPVLQKAHAAVRARVSHLDRDRELAPDIAAIQQLVESGAFRAFVPEVLPSRDVASA